MNYWLLKRRKFNQVKKIINNHNVETKHEVMQICRNNGLGETEMLKILNYYLKKKEEVDK